MADYNSIHTGAAIDAAITKVAGIEAGADVTDTANVTAAGALMDSEVTNLAAVKAFDPTDYATAAQGTLADSAVQPGDDASTLGSGAAADGLVLTSDGAGGTAWEAASGGGGSTDYVRTRAGTVQDLFDMAETWNDGATTFTSIKMNVTDTASASGSLLMDLQVGGTSKFSVDKTGLLKAARVWTLSDEPFTAETFALGSSDGTSIKGVDSSGQLGFSVGSKYYMGNKNNAFEMNRAVALGWSASPGSGHASATLSGDLYLARDAANTLAQRNSTNAQTFNLYNTYTDASNYERGFMRYNSGIFEIGAEIAGTGSQRNVRVQTAGILFLEGGSETRFTDGGALTHRISSGFGLQLLAGPLHISNSFTVATLPSPSVGMMARVTDATTPAVGSTVTGGGAANALCWYNGTNWTVIGV